MIIKNILFMIRKSFYYQKSLERWFHLLFIYYRIMELYFSTKLLDFQYRLLWKICFILKFRWKIRLNLTIIFICFQNFNCNFISKNYLSQTWLNLTTLFNFFSFLQKNTIQLTALSPSIPYISSHHGTYHKKDPREPTSINPIWSWRWDQCSVWFSR